jgi:glutamyl/glutaminyl-tRNA synthetase
MGITLVMRGDDHISNTPKQILLYRALGADLPVFAHLPMIHGMDGKKLSKRHGATAVGDYQHQGLLPGAMLNFLALLGWSPGGDREVMMMEEMISLFSPDGLQRKAAIFDPKKLEWMNGQHLSRVPLAELEPRITPLMISAGLIDSDGIAARKEWYMSLLDLLRVRARTTDDIVRQAGPYFLDSIEYEPEAVAKNWKDRASTNRSPPYPSTINATRITSTRLSHFIGRTPASILTLVCAASAGYCILHQLNSASSSDANTRRTPSRSNSGSISEMASAVTLPPSTPTWPMATAKPCCSAISRASESWRST